MIFGGSVGPGPFENDKEAIHPVYREEMSTFDFIKNQKNEEIFCFIDCNDVFSFFQFTNYSMEL